MPARQADLFVKIESRQERRQRIRRRGQRQREAQVGAFERQHVQARGARARAPDRPQSSRCAASATAWSDPAALNAIDLLHSL